MTSLRHCLLVIFSFLSFHYSSTALAFVSPSSTSESFFMAQILLPSLTVTGFRNSSLKLEGERPLGNGSLYLALVSNQILANLPSFPPSPSSNQILAHYKQVWTEGKLRSSYFYGTTLTFTDNIASSIDGGLVFGYNNPGWPFLYAPISASIYSDGYLLSIQAGLNPRWGALLFDLAVRKEIMSRFDQSRNGNNFYFIIGAGKIL